MMLFTRKKNARVEQGALNTLVDQSVSIENDHTLGLVVRFEKSVRFDGKLCGSLIGTGQKNCSLVIGPEAMIDGNVSAQAVVVLGKVRGTVAGDYVEVRSGAWVTGDINYGRLEIHQGANVQGRLFQIEGGQRSEQTDVAAVTVPAPGDCAPNPAGPVNAGATQTKL